MNNYDHIMEGGIDALLDWYYKALRCESCVYKHSKDEAAKQGKYSAFCDFEGCNTGRKEWLEAEYIEPDSIEKLARDVGLICEAIENAGKWPCAYAFGDSNAGGKALGCRVCRLWTKDVGEELLTSCVYKALSDIEGRLERLVEE